MFYKNLVLACFIGMPFITLSMNQEKRKLEKDLFIASGKGQLDTVQALVQQGVCVNSNQKDARTPLMVAALNNHRMVVAELLKSKAQPQAQDRLGFTYKEYGLFGCVAAAAQKDSKRKFDEEGAHAWIKEGADKAVLNVCGFPRVQEQELHAESPIDMQGYPILESSLYDGGGSGSTHWVIPLLQLGANPNVWKNCTPVSMVHGTDSEPTINALIAHGAHINARRNRDNHTAIEKAVLSNAHAYVKCLLHHKAELEFDFRSCVGKKEIIRHLRDFGKYPKMERYARAIRAAVPSFVAVNVLLMVEYIPYQNTIFDAIFEMDYEGVKQFIKEDPETVHTISSFSPVTPLVGVLDYYTHCSDDTKIIANNIAFLLLENGANPDDYTPEGQSLIAYVRSTNNEIMLNHLEKLQKEKKEQEEKKKGQELQKFQKPEEQQKPPTSQKKNSPCAVM